MTVATSVTTVYAFVEKYSARKRDFGKIGDFFDTRELKKKQPSQKTKEKFCKLLKHNTQEWNDFYLWTEERTGRVLESLEKRGRALVLGVSGLGKTRLVIEVLRRLSNDDLDFKGRLVVAVDKSPDVLSHSVMGKSLGRKRRSVVLLFDDLEQYVGKFDIDKLVSNFRRVSKKVAVVATCRIEEFPKIENAPDVTRLFSEKDGDYIRIPIYSVDEGHAIAKGVQKEFPKDFRGTADCIVLQTMRGREYYKNVLNDSERSVLRAIKLLRFLGITSALYIEEVKLVWDGVFHGQDHGDWNTCFSKVKQYYNLWTAPWPYSRNKDPVLVSIPDAYLDPERGVVDDYPSYGEKELLEQSKIIISIFKECARKREGPYTRLLDIGDFFRRRDLQKYAFECYDAVSSTLPEPKGPLVACIVEPVLMRKFLALHSLGDYPKALAVVDKLLEMNQGPWKSSNLWVFWNDKGDCLARLGQIEKAVPCYENALKERPNEIITMMNLSEASLATGELERGLEMAKKAVDIANEPEHKVVSKYLCICAHFLRKEREDAERDMEQLRNYVKNKDVRVKSWSFSPLVPTLSKKLKEQDRKKIFALISFLEGKGQT